jgi:flagellar biosynthesis/type III secretory pathway protein FliH
MNEDYEKGYAVGWAEALAKEQEGKDFDAIQFLQAEIKRLREALEHIEYSSAEINPCRVRRALDLTNEIARTALQADKGE